MLPVGVIWLMVNKKYTLRMQSVICSNSIYVYLSFVPLLLGINSACYGEMPTSLQTTPTTPVCKGTRGNILARCYLARARLPGGHGTTGRDGTNGSSLRKRVEVFREGRTKQFRDAEREG